MYIIALSYFLTYLYFIWKGTLKPWKAEKNVVVLNTTFIKQVTEINSLEHARKEEKANCEWFPNKKTHVKAPWS